MDEESLTLWINGNVFHDTYRLTSLCHVVEDHQLVCANCDLADAGGNKLEIRVALYESKLRYSFFDSKGTLIVS